MIATMLGTALIALRFVRSARADLPRILGADKILATMGGPAGAGILMLLALIGFSAHALALLSTGRAVGAQWPLVFAADGANYAHAVLADLAWRILQFSIPTLAGLACCASLILERRRRIRRRAEELPSAR